MSGRKRNFAVGVTILLGLMLSSSVLASTIEIWNLDKNSVGKLDYKDFAEPNGKISAISLSDDSRFLAVSSYMRISPPIKKKNNIIHNYMRIDLWNIKSRRKVKTVKILDGFSTESIQLSRDNSKAVVYISGSSRIVDLNKYNNKTIYPSDLMRFDDDGKNNLGDRSIIECNAKFLYSVYDTGERARISVSEVKSGKLIQSIAIKSLDRSYKFIHSRKCDRIALADKAFFQVYKISNGFLSPLGERVFKSREIDEILDVKHWDGNFTAMYDPSIFASLGDIYSETYNNSGTIIKREIIKLPRSPSSLNLHFGSGILGPTKFFIFRGDVYIFDKSKVQPQKRLVGNYDYDVFFGDKTTNQLFLVNKSD